MSRVIKLTRGDGYCAGQTVWIDPVAFHAAAPQDGSIVYTAHKDAWTVLESPEQILDLLNAPVETLVCPAEETPMVDDVSGKIATWLEQEAVYVMDDEANEVMTGLAARIRAGEWAW